MEHLMRKMIGSMLEVAETELKKAQDCKTDAEQNTWLMHMVTASVFSGMVKVLQDVKETTR